MNGRPWLKEHTDMLLALYATHHDHEIAERTGHATVTVFYRRRDMGLPACSHGVVRYGTWEDLPPASMAAIRKAAKMAV